MNYEFPVITNIKDVLPAIEGKDEFYVCEKENFTVINYLMQDSKTFPEITDRNSAFLRECRGIKFHPKTGEILSRPYNKFFNMFEKQETFLENIDFSKPHVVLSKLDGSMIHNFCHNGKIEWLTKMGAENFNNSVKDFVKKHPKYEDFVWEVHEEGFTAIFEWCSSSIEQRIVITHAEDNLILTAIRNTVYGNYIPYKNMVEWAEEYDIPVVESIEMDFINFPNESIEQIRKWEGKEGVVIRFDNMMAKIKADQYVMIHKNKELINSEKAVAELIINNGIDDVKSFLLPDDLKMVNDYEDDFTACIKNLSKFLYKAMNEIGDMPRKDFALVKSQEMLPLFRAMCFHVWENRSSENCYNTVISYFKKNCNNNKNFKVLKEQFLSDINYGIQGEE
jgi:RNA ligase